MTKYQKEIKHNNAYQASIKDFPPAKRKLLEEAFAHPSKAIHSKLTLLALRTYPNSPLQRFVREAITYVEKHIDIKDKNSGMKTRTSYSRKNPERKTARQMAEEFHGRKVRKEIIIDELYREPSSYAVIGKLEELVVTSLQESSYEYPINFEGQNKNPKKIIEVCCDCDGKQIYFVGGDQNLDSILAELETSDSLTQDLIVLGFCHAITYFTDKHHLEGDDEQKDGVPYEHEFGEQGGTWPVLLYDMINKKIMLSGGTYEVRDVGIWN